MNTIPRTYSEIDTLREKFDREEKKDKLAILNEINAHVEELEKNLLFCIVDFNKKTLNKSLMSTKEVTDEKFEKEVIKSDKPTVVDF